MVLEEFAPGAVQTADRSCLVTPCAAMELTSIFSYQSVEPHSKHIRIDLKAVGSSFPVTRTSSLVCTLLRV